jgi:hypothetical protein
MRDFQSELQGERCYDRQAEFEWRTRGAALVDAMLQNRRELILFCQWIEAAGIGSYLEIGVWTGRLVSTLQSLFGFERVAACDLGWAQQRGLPLSLPPELDFLQASSRSDEYRAWREARGSFDLILIDGDHSYEGVKADFELNRELPHRFLAFHDIANTHPAVRGVKQLWEELEGYKLELVRPLACSRWNMGIGIWSDVEDPRAFLASEGA